MTWRSTAVARARASGADQLICECMRSIAERASLRSHFPGRQFRAAAKSSSSRVRVATSLTSGVSPNRPISVTKGDRRKAAMSLKRVT